MRASRILRTTGVVALVTGAAVALGALVVRDQIARHQRDLFSPRVLRRFAALGYLSGLAASVEAVQLLRDFLAWEPSHLLRKRARLILARMERQLDHGSPAECAG